jgi:hypothetical protein
VAGFAGDRRMRQVGSQAGLDPAHDQARSCSAKSLRDAFELRAGVRVGWSDVENAREALRLIDQRGFGRGKQLLRELERLL